jgi:hypothetical protein
MVNDVSFLPSSCDSKLACRNGSNSGHCPVGRWNENCGGEMSEGRRDKRHEMGREGERKRERRERGPEEIQEKELSIYTSLHEPSANFSNQQVKLVTQHRVGFIDNSNQQFTAHALTGCWGSIVPHAFL